jgi:histidinol-phosphate aminotransferase
VSRLAIEAGLGALSDGEHVEKTLALTNSGRSYLTSALERFGFHVLPSHTNFVTVDLGSEAALATFTSALLGRGLIVRPLGAFGLPRHARISIGTEEEIAAVVRAVSHILPLLRKGREE